MFNLAQVFYVSSDTVQNVSKVGLSKIDLFFAAKPKIENNKSGIYAPGVEIFISEVKDRIPTALPVLSAAINQPQISRREYSEISTSNDSSVPTSFYFKSPVTIGTDSSYAILIKFDGNEDFVLWESRIGDFLIGTTTVCDGPSGKYIGNLYGYIGPSVIYPDSLTNTYSADNWKPFAGQDLKFSVYCARYSVNSIPVSNSVNTSNYVSISGKYITLVAPVVPSELISFDKKTSAFDNIVYGDYVYQDQQYFPGGYSTPATCGNYDTVTPVLKLNSFNYANGRVASWNDVFTFSGNIEKYIVIKSLNHYGANQHATFIRKAVDINNNNLLIDEPLPVLNSAAYFFPAPAARISNLSRSYVSGSYKDLLVLNDSNANSSVRFVNDCIISSTINFGGNAYSNTDYIVITGFENITNEVMGGYQGTANLVTNSTGGITNTFFSNVGCGFVNGYSYTIKSNTGANSVGSGANLAFLFGATLKTGLGGDSIFFSKFKVVNMRAAQITPSIALDFPSGAEYSIKLNTMYYGVKSANTFSGMSYYIDTVAMTTPIDLKNEYTQAFTSNTPVIVSRSNQFVVPYANGYVANSSVIGSRFSNVATYTITTTSNNDFAMISIKPKNIDSYYGKYSINNDYTNENTNYGNAISKHVTTRISLEKDYKAEDLLIYLTAFRPANTDFKVYARVHNSSDGDSFDSKDWSLLEQIDGLGVYSNPTNTSDMKEYTYNFPAYPNTDYISPGTITTSLSNAVITGSGTNFTSNLAVNDLVKVYSPLFANTNYIISSVSSITNSSVLTLSEPISNNSVTGSGLKIDRLKYSHQTFNNVTSANVARYYNSNLVAYDTFDTFQIKLVLLSDNESVVPRIDDCRAIGCSS